MPENAWICAVEDGDMLSGCVDLFYFFNRKKKTKLSEESLVLNYCINYISCSSTFTIILANVEVSIVDTLLNTMTEVP